MNVVRQGGRKGCTHLEKAWTLIDINIDMINHLQYMFHFWYLVSIFAISAKSKKKHESLVACVYISRK